MELTREQQGELIEIIKENAPQALDRLVFELIEFGLIDAEVGAGIDSEEEGK